MFKGVIMRQLMQVASFILITMLFGCASGAKMESMVYNGLEKTYDEALKTEVAVETVFGGKNTNPLWASKISNDAFNGAVKMSLTNQGLYSETGRYQLNVILLNVRQPLFGFDLTVTMHARYILSDTQGKQDQRVVIFDENVVSSHTATLGDSFVGAKRLRLANEGSGMNNIEKFLALLSELQITSAEISLID
jgi:hypothetical protein